MICATFVIFNLLIFVEDFQSFLVGVLAGGQVFANLAIFAFFNLLIFCGCLFLRGLFLQFGNFYVLQSFNLLWLAFCGGQFLQGKEKAPSLNLLTLANVENTFLLTPLFSHLR